MADALDVIRVILAGLMAGGLLVVEIGLVRTIRGLTDATAIRLHIAFDHYVEWSMPPLTIATFLVGVAGLIVNSSISGATTTLIVLGLIATAVVAAISQLINVPINAAMRKWEPGTVPPEYPALRRRWDGAHRARTIAGQLALVLFAVALISA